MRLNERQMRVMIRKVIAEVLRPRLKKLKEQKYIDDDDDGQSGGNREYGRSGLSNAANGIPDDASWNEIYDDDDDVDQNDFSFGQVPYEPKSRDLDDDYNDDEDDLYDDGESDYYRRSLDDSITTIPIR